MPLTANWIWSADDPTARNVLMQFRRALALEAAPTRAELHVSADTRYLLYVNGERLGYGPARNYHAHYEYDTYDLTRHLRAGENVIAVVVIHWGESTFHQIVARAGLLAQLDVEGAEALITDHAWRVKRAAAYEQAVPRINCQMAWEEQVDARLVDEGWTEVGFDDSGWAAATVVGLVGIAPWGNLSARTIPFLTDEPLTALRATALGVFRRPQIILALHAGPYFVPGDRTANRHIVDGLIATVLHVPVAGIMRFKRCSVAGGDPPTGETLRILIDGVVVEWQPALVDYEAVLRLEAGPHVVLIDWNGKTHDMDLTLTAGGMEGLWAASPLPEETGLWAIAVAPGAARSAALAASNVEALLNCGSAWQPVAALDTPAADVCMDVTASEALTERENPTRLPLTVPPVPAGQAQHYVIDFGRLGIGWLELDVEAPAGTVVDLLAYEAVQEGRPLLTWYINNTLRYICREGRQTYTSTVRRGARYVRVAVHGHRDAVVIHRVGLRLSTYPWNIQGAFRSSDPRLNQIWEMCTYTLRLCSEDTFTDCPTYEQTLWTGDACQADVLVHHAVHGDPRLTRRCLVLVAHSLERLPIANAQVPSGWENDLLPNWAFMWAMGCASYYAFTGDKGFAREVYPALAKQATFVEANRNAAGVLSLPGFWHLLDWADMPREPEDVVPHESCLAVAALEATATLAEVAGKPEEGVRWRQVAAALAEAVNRECWHPERRAYTDLWLPSARDEHISQPTNIAALLAGVAPGGRAAAVLPHLLEPSPGWVTSGSPWMVSLAGMLLAERGQMQPVLDAIRDRWGDMLDKGAGTAWETFPGFQPNWWTRSWCHAWSALPAYLLSAYVLGIRPLEPGYRRALIAPQLADLAWADGQVPTPRGPIAVRVERHGGDQKLTVATPDGVAAEIHLPAMGWETPAVEGTGAEFGRMGDKYVVGLPAGAWARVSSRRS